MTDDERWRLESLEEGLARDDPGFVRRVGRLGDRLAKGFSLTSRWVALALCGAASIALLCASLTGHMPAIRGVAILLNLYVVTIAWLLWRARANGR
jgi:hypothetical protein